MPGCLRVRRRADEALKVCLFAARPLKPAGIDVPGEPHRCASAVPCGVDLSSTGVMRLWATQIALTEADLLFQGRTVDIGWTCADAT